MLTGRKQAWQAFIEGKKIYEQKKHQLLNQLGEIKLLYVLTKLYSNLNNFTLTSLKSNLLINYPNENLVDFLKQHLVVYFWALEKLIIFFPIQASKLLTLFLY